MSVTARDVAEIVECGCCPIDEAAAARVAKFLSDVNEYGDEDIVMDKVRTEASALYYYEVWSKAEKTTK